MKKTKNKYYINKSKNFSGDDLQENLKKFLIILGVIIAIILILWFVIEIKNGNLFKNDENENSDIGATIQYDEIIAGQTFNRKDNEYYVIFSDSNKEFFGLYKNYISSSDDKIYIVDVANEINDKYISEETNANAQSSNDLKVKDNTLIKIKDGKNVLYLEGYKEILNEIKN